MTDENLPPIDEEEILRMTTDIVSSFLTHNSVPADSIPDLIRSVHATMGEISGSSAKPEPKSKPAIPVSKSITDEHIVCLEDGKKLKMLKRHLMTHYGMTPEDYRAKWGLPNDYPMVAPNYAEKRRQLAKAIGLGKKKGKKK